MFLFVELLKVIVHKVMQKPKEDNLEVVVCLWDGWLFFFFTKVIPNISNNKIRVVSLKSYIVVCIKLFRLKCILLVLLLSLLLLMKLPLFIFLLILL